MESHHVQFNETELKQVIFSAALILSVERAGHERDWEIIDSFAAGYWQTDYGDYSQFQKRIFDDINELLQNEVELFETMDSLIAEFSLSLNEDQKSIVLGLLGYLFAVDGISRIEASKLFTTFLDRLGIEQPGFS